MRRVSSNSNCRFLKQVNRPLRLDGNRIRSRMASLSERDFGSKNRQFACRDGRHRLVAASTPGSLQWLRLITAAGDRFSLPGKGKTPGNLS